MRRDGHSSVAENTGRPAAMIGISQRPSGPGGLMGRVARRAGRALGGGNAGRVLGKRWASAGRTVGERWPGQAIAC